MRRYLFVLAETGGNNQRVVCIEESYEGFSDEGGEPLFHDDEASPLLQQTLDFLEEYQKQYLRTESFVNRLRENDLLMSLNAKVDMFGGQQFGLTGLLAVDERRLRQLRDDRLPELFRSGELSWIYRQLMPLLCMGRMIEHIAVRHGEGAAAAEPKK